MDSIIDDIVQATLLADSGEPLSIMAYIAIGIFLIAYIILVLAVWVHGESATGSKGTTFITNSIITSIITLICLAVYIITAKYLWIIEIIIAIFVILYHLYVGTFYSWIKKSISLLKDRYTPKRDETAEKYAEELLDNFNN